MKKTKNFENKHLSNVSRFTENFARCLENEAICLYCSKSYGLELLLFLYIAECEEIDNGVEDTYDAIKFNKPRRAAFSTFINTLIDKKLMLTENSAVKGSKRILRLPEEAKRCVEQLCGRHRIY